MELMAYNRYICCFPFLSTLCSEAGLISSGGKPGQDSMKDQLLPMHQTLSLYTQAGKSNGKAKPIHLGTSSVAGVARRMTMWTSLRFTKPNQKSSRPVTLEGKLKGNLHCLMCFPLLVVEQGDVTFPYSNNNNNNYNYFYYYYYYFYYYFFYYYYFFFFFYYNYYYFYYYYYNYFYYNNNNYNNNNYYYFCYYYYYYYYHY
ncbi:hypothetical protein DPMN_059503 [Dreissena polymorpha]|uniref:Uncharacterized protein n=1 Tax=Dreissena polymorpha TaxID=45954 RepID=A0A9D4C4A7_DREPO|nr:hypothetical protein DPMN_059503 [Dreissena polymorpha]